MPGKDQLAFGVVQALTQVCALIYESLSGCPVLPLHGFRVGVRNITIQQQIESRRHPQVVKVYRPQSAKRSESRHQVSLRHT